MTLNFYMFSNEKIEWDFHSIILKDILKLGKLKYIPGLFTVYLGLFKQTMQVKQQIDV